VNRRFNVSDGSEVTSDTIALSAGAPQALNARGDTIVPWVGVFLSRQVAAHLSPHLDFCLASRTVSGQVR
jgi:hypothetical protein